MKLVPLMFAVSAGLVGGCFSTDLDPDAVGAFACGENAGNADCPTGQACSNGRCQDIDVLPTIAISGPDPTVAPMFDATLGDEIDEVLLFGVPQAFTLVDPAANSEHVFGEGHISVSVDGDEVATITSGTIAGGREVGISIGNEVGAHRLSVRLMRNDGDAYDHQGARDNNLYWLRDGQPRIAVTKPWPGDRFSLDEQELEIEVGVIDFEVVPPGGADTPRLGHAHVHYDAPFPECPEESACDSDYMVITDTPIEGSGGLTRPNDDTVARLPAETAARDVEVTAILRNVNHSPYRLPDDGADFPVADGTVITDTVVITRD